MKKPFFHFIEFNAIDGRSFQLFGSFLSMDERKRAGDLVGREAKRRYIICRGYLRKMIGELVSQDPREVRFSYTSAGKPRLDRDDGKTVNFSLSHTHGMAFFGFFKEALVGVDIEYIRPLGDLRSLAEMYLRDNEAALIDEAPCDQQLDLFFRFWTAKEAYLKALGCGISGRTQVPFSFPGKGEGFSFKDGAQRTWDMRLVLPDSRYRAAAVWQRV